VWTLIDTKFYNRAPVKKNYRWILVSKYFAPQHSWHRVVALEPSGDWNYLNSSKLDWAELY